MKKYIQYILLSLILGLICHFNAFSQLNEKRSKIFTDIPEKVFVHGNTTTLLTGETLYYKFYTWNTSTESLSEISKVGYVELIKENGKSVLKQKIRLKNGMGHGDFFIPTKLETGNYKLVAYTRWMLNEPVSEVFQTDIFVINPFRAAPSGNIAKTTRDSLKIDSKPQIPNLKTKNKSDGAINLKKFNYGKRELVKFSISSMDNQFINGNYSISVRKTDELPGGEFPSAEKFMESTINDTGEADKYTRYLPELRGELIIGKIQNKIKPGNVRDKSIALSIPGENFVFELVNTDSTGVFRFILNDGSGKEYAVIQVMEDDRENYSIQLNPFNIDFSSLPFENFTLVPELEETIEARSIAVQIENAYYYLKKDSILPREVARPFFYPLGQEYVLEDYTSFPSLQKTIVEVVPLMYSTRENGNFEIHLYDTDNVATKGVYGETLVLVDGLMLQDVDKFFDYDTRKIHKITLVPHGYLYGPKIFNGVVNFVTKEQDFNSGLNGDFVIKKELLRPLPETNYFQPNYAKLKSPRIPDYRYQLLWLPEVSLNNETKTISFHTSDVTGTFEIVLEGFTASGEPVSAYETFVVR